MLNTVLAGLLTVSTSVILFFHALPLILRSLHMYMVLGQVRGVVGTVRQQRCRAPLVCLVIQQDRARDPFTCQQNRKDHFYLCIFYHFSENKKSNRKLRLPNIGKIIKFFLFFQKIAQPYIVLWTLEGYVLHCVPCIGISIVGWSCWQYPAQIRRCCSLLFCSRKAQSTECIAGMGNSDRYVGMAQNTTPAKFWWGNNTVR